VLTWRTDTGYSVALVLEERITLTDSLWMLDDLVYRRGQQL
jgi:hypothetical protein